MGISKPRVVYTPEEISYLKAQFDTSRTMSEIQRDYNRQFNMNRSEVAIMGLRTSLRRKLRKAAEENGSAGETTQAAKPVVKEPSVKKLSKKFLQSIPDTVPIETLKKGTLLYHPDCGVMQSQGLEKVSIGLSSIKTLSLREVHAMPGKIKTPELRINIPESQIPAKNIRPLYDAESMAKALEYFQACDAPPTIPGNTTARKMDFLKGLDSSGSLRDTCELITRIYKSSTFSVGRGFSEIGLKAIKKFTGEYASVHGMKVGQADMIVKEALGFKHIYQSAPLMTSPSP